MFPFNHSLRRLQLPALLFLLLCSTQSLAQQATAKGAPLEIVPASLPRAYVKQPYEAQLQAQGGILPLGWEVTEGRLPAGFVLQNDGKLVGTPTETGTFTFTATVHDSGKPAYERSHQYSVTVVSPLMAVWGRYPKVVDQRIEGSVLVSNDTDHDFDLTVIVLAVNEIGRATAIGYQHFALKKNTESVELPFGEHLPPASYDLHVDAVAEVASTDSIYRARLQPQEKMVIAGEP